MARRDSIWFPFGLLIAIMLGLMACSGGPSASDPKEVVIHLFGFMERNDRAGIAHLLDLPALMSNRDDDYALQKKEPRVFYNPEDILDDLTGDGETKRVWFSMQRVIGNTEISGDTAFVEVSFIDKAKDIQYYNKFGLHRVNDRWKIYTFRALSGR